LLFGQAVVRSEGRKCRITASRARSNDIGSERENSRIGTRRPPGWAAFVEPESCSEFFRAIVPRPDLHRLGIGWNLFALQQARYGLIPSI